MLVEFQRLISYRDKGTEERVVETEPIAIRADLILSISPGKFRKSARGNPEEYVDCLVLTYAVASPQFMGSTKDNTAIRIEGSFYGILAMINEAVKEKSH